MCTRDLPGRGAAREIDFTWTREKSEIPTLVTVEFLARGKECELVLTHEGFPELDIMRRYEGGWGQIADKFAAYLAQRVGMAGA